jgi:hypothetical protein
MRTLPGYLAAEVNNTAGFNRRMRKTERPVVCKG